MQLTRWTRWIVMTLVCAAAPLAARAQTTAPSPAAEQEPEPSEGRLLGSIGPPHTDIDAAQEWEQRSDAFFKEHAPKRWATLQNIEDEERQQTARGHVLLRFRNLERLKNADPDMYELNLKRFSVEDEIYGLRFPLWQERRPPTPEELSQLREKVSTLVDLSLEERELRVQRLREMLKREEEFMVAERNAREAAISERLSIIEQPRGLGLGRRREVDGGGEAYPRVPSRDRQPQPAPTP